MLERFSAALAWTVIGVTLLAFAVSTAASTYRILKYGPPVVGCAR